MGALKKLKPKNFKLDLAKLQPSSILYMCKTKVLDRALMKLRGHPFDEELATRLEQHNYFCFVVTTTLEYDVLSSEGLEPWAAGHDIELNLLLKDERPAVNTSANDCFNQYVNGLR